MSLLYAGLYRRSPVLLPAAPTSHGQRVMGRTPRAVAVAIRMEERLQPFLQHHRSGGLGHPVSHVRHPQGPDPRPVILRYLHRSHRPREIRPRRHPVPQLVEIVSLFHLELGDAHSVHARRPVVGPDLLPRLEHETFGDLKRLHLGLGSHHRFLPRRVDHQLTPVCPAPWLQPHYRAFIATTSRPAPVSRIGTLPLTVSAAWGPPSRR